MPWSSNNGWENGSWCVITSESGFAHTGTVINDEGGYIIVSHFYLVFDELGN
jgi:hypothetical protein